VLNPVTFVTRSGPSQKRVPVFILPVFEIIRGGGREGVPKQSSEFCLQSLEPVPSICEIEMKNTRERKGFLLVQLLDMSAGLSGE